MTHPLSNFAREVCITEEIHKAFPDAQIANVPSPIYVDRWPRYMTKFPEERLILDMTYYHDGALNCVYVSDFCRYYLYVEDKVEGISENLACKLSYFEICTIQGTFNMRHADFDTEAVLYDPPYCDGRAIVDTLKSIVAALRKADKNPVNVTPENLASFIYSKYLAIKQKKLEAPLARFKRRARFGHLASTYGAILSKETGEKMGNLAIKRSIIWGSISKSGTVILTDNGDVAVVHHGYCILYRSGFVADDAMISAIQETLAINGKSSVRMYADSYNYYRLVIELKKLCKQ